QPFSLAAEKQLRCRCGAHEIIAVSSWEFPIFRQHSRNLGFGRLRGNNAAPESRPFGSPLTTAACIDCAVVRLLGIVASKMTGDCAVLPKLSGHRPNAVSNRLSSIFHCIVAGSSYL